MRAPGFDYGGEWVDIDTVWIDQRVEDYATLTSRGYQAPILREHKSGQDGNGEREGGIPFLFRALVEDVETLCCAMDFVDPADAEKMRTGRMPYVSVGLGSLITDDSNKFTDTVLEVSLVGIPHAMTGPTHVLRTAACGRVIIGRATMTEPKEPEEERGVNADGGGAGIEEGEAGIASALREFMGKMEERMGALEAAHAPKEREADVPDAEPAEPSENEVALRARVDQLEREANWTKFQKNFAAEGYVKITPKVQRALYDVLHNAGDTGAKLRTAMVEAHTVEVSSGKPAPVVIEQGSIYRGAGWSKGGEAPNAEGVDFDALDEAAMYDEILKRHNGDSNKANDEMAAKVWNNPGYHAALKRSAV